MSTQFNLRWELEIQYNPTEQRTERYELYFFLGQSRLFEPIWLHRRGITELRTLNGYLENLSLEDSDVISYLGANLSWRVKEPYSDQEIEKSRFQSLKVFVVSSDNEPSDDEPTRVELPDVN